jgi:hypothetical protein
MERKYPNSSARAAARRECGAGKWAVQCRSELVDSAPRMNPENMGRLEKVIARHALKLPEP